MTTFQPPKGKTWASARKVSDMDLGHVETVLNNLHQILHKSTLTRSAATLASTATVSLGTLLPAIVQGVEALDRIAGALEVMAYDDPDQA